MGFIFVGMAIAGAFLPILPTVPFLIVAAFFFSKGSKRFHDWLMHHVHFGPLLRNWYKHGAITRRVKWVATISVVLGLSLSFSWVPLAWQIKLAVALTALAVLIYIWLRPEPPADEPVERKSTES